MDANVSFVQALTPIQVLPKSASQIVGPVRRKSSVFAHLIEVESAASGSMLRSISNFSATGKLTNDDDLDLNEVDTYVIVSNQLNFVEIMIQIFNQN
jgi:hypothetical protein